jgi:hypothetical protein
MINRPSKQRRIVVVAALYGIATLRARRLGYPLEATLLFGAAKGHLFTTIWVPGASIKSVKLGWWRFQRCPVGKHWTLVSAVKDANLTDEERRFADTRHDLWLP